MWWVRKHVKERKISALIDGELSPKEQEAIFRHIDQCQRCKDKLQQWRQVDYCLVRHYERPVPVMAPALLEQKIMAQIRRHQETKEAADCALSSSLSRSWRPYCLSLQVAAATCLVTLGIVLGTLMGAKLTLCLVRKQEQIDLLAVLSPEEIYSTSFAEMSLEMITEGEW
ncbi:MAG: zf-HC2 domain-containing protein [bacterium]|nr:zf-HC2 domain-containing protein [bacterium]